MKQLYEIRTYKQYDRDVKLAVRRGLDIDKLLDAVKLLQQGNHCLLNIVTIFCLAITRAIGNAILIPIGYFSTRKILKSELFPFTVQVLMPTFLVKGRKDNLY